MPPDATEPMVRRLVSPFRVGAEASREDATAPAHAIIETQCAPLAQDEEKGAKARRTSAEPGGNSRREGDGGADLPKGRTAG